MKKEVKIYSAGHEGVLDLNIRTKTINQRLASAAIGILIGLIATAVLSLIPFVHFFGFIFGILLTIFLGVRNFKTVLEMENSNSMCPACNAIFKVSPRKYKLPFYDSCESCHREVVVSYKE